ncbi:acyltransferase family protein [Argonema antarcticum]|uniref:acyltransferase family protein n=1 Tax=Argonema antarcticum TaxID=2942763 RepID=UPI0020110BEC|nr:acyltransferase [Argonema antarcticum]MCL1475562.1 acyltransferase [Argonema antarcticum A004/B2]
MEVPIDSTTQPPKESKPGYIIQLDALRAIAVLGVLVYHWLPKELFLNSKLQWGILGVKLFFVLSGFLITGILLKCRDKIDFGGQNAGVTIRRFYIRRFLRLLPIYYLVLFLTIKSVSGWNLSYLWHFTYTSNIYFAFNKWDVNSPFWTLSVEEQFYLFWPLIIVFVPRKHLLKVILITILIAPLFRMLFFDVFKSGIKVELLTPACLDSLGMGSLLAYYYHDPQLLKNKNYLTNFCFWVGGTLFITLIFTRQYINGAIEFGLFDTVTALYFTWLVDRAARGFTGIAGNILEFKPLVNLGKISYGIYVYHSFLASKVPAYFNSKFHLFYPSSIWIEFFFKTVATIIIASFSWQFFEKPINNLKKYFEI